MNEDKKIVIEKNNNRNIKWILIGGFSAIIVLLLIILSLASVIIANQNDQQNNDQQNNTELIITDISELPGIGEIEFIPPIPVGPEMPGIEIIIPVNPELPGIGDGGVWGITPELPGGPNIINPGGPNINIGPNLPELPGIGIKQLKLSIVITVGLYYLMDQFKTAFLENIGFLITVFHDFLGWDNFLKTILAFFAGIWNTLNNYWNSWINFLNDHIN